MNKFGIFLFVVASTISFSSVAGQTCTRDVKSYFEKDTKDQIEFIDMKDKCVSETEKQIKMEVTASMKYLSMGAYFARDNVNRPGFAKFFFDAASEEREHAQKLIEYLSMRGRYLNNNKGEPSTFLGDASVLKELVKDAEKASFLGLGNKLKSLDTTDDKSTSGLIALQNALNMEVAVTNSIRNLVKECENDNDFNHYHFVDYLTGEFLEEQYKGQRDLAGKISTLGKMVDGNGAQLGEFLFDKQL